jgi:rRNA maturation RNase YbeY
MIKYNSKKYKTEFSNELFRVIIHGILHLLGYEDKETDSKILMTQKEDYYLSLL